MNPNLASVREALSERYVVERELGRGGMATVYLARDLRHEREVAVKVLHPELAEALGAERFTREIRLIAGLQHPHILPLFDSGELNGVLYYVMPCITGGSLRDRIRAEGALPTSQALRIAREVANALAHAHSRGILHRDIKPENILLADGHALLADFGVARSISVGEVREHLTASGLIVGTPVYMSPEQASGEADLDGRSDIYSLGVVLYEMLMGQPPFGGSTLHALTVQRLMDPIPPIAERRADVPAEVDGLILRALGPTPADRFASAAAMAEAIPEPSAVDGMITRRPRRRSWRWAVPLSGAAVAAALLAWLPPLLSAPALDASTYAVLPLEHRGGAAPALLDGDKCGLLLHDAMSRWQGIQLVDEIRITDAHLRRHGRAVSLSDNLELAREVGAGRMVAGQLFALRDSVIVRAALYDVTRQRLIREHSIRLAADLSDASTKFDQLADSLLIGTGHPRSAVAGAMGTRHLPAWQAYARGHRALAAWRLDTARVWFRRAAEQDQEYADAFLWLTNVSVWNGDPGTPELKHAAERAAALSSRLERRDRTLAQANLALATARYQDACAHYASLHGRDSADFAAWFGLGECHRRDGLVVRDARSPSGWRFRSSYRTAIRAYERALQAVPSSHLAFRGEAFARLRSLLFSEPNMLRRGHHGNPDSIAFVAFASLEADTLAFVPHPIADVARGAPATRPAGARAAVARNQAKLEQIVMAWVRAFPESPDALGALGEVLEARGDLTDTRAGHSALTAVRRARARAPDSDAQLRLGAAEIRLLLKLGEFGAARAIADSLSGRVASPTPAQASQLAALAALTGHVHRSASLMVMAIPADSFVAPSGRVVESAPPIAAATRAMIAYASLGAPADSIRVLEQRVARLAQSWEAPARRERVASDALALPLSLSVPTMGANAALRIRGPSTDLVRIQTAVARGDTAAARTAFRALARYRQSSFRSGDLPINGTFHESWLLLALGDTASAIERLDLTLNALPSLGSRLVTSVPQAGAFPRAMALRAELAHATHDRAVARRWANAVVSLWSSADPELQPTVRRMRVIAAAAS